MPISVVFDPPLPSDSPSTFNTKAFTLLGDLNDWSTQANALPGEVATNLTTLLAAPPAIGSTTPAAGNFTTLSAGSAVTVADGFDVRWGAGSTFIAGNSSSDVIQLAAAGAERARVSSSGLAVTGALSASGTVGLNGDYTSFNGTGYIRGDAPSWMSFQCGSSGYRFRSVDNSISLATLDASGNLGIRVTPSAWVVSAKAIQFAYPYFGMASEGSAVMGFNAYESSAGVWTYKSTDEASLFKADTTGGYTWHTASSGTAGNPISFTQAMTLDANGNLLLGKTSTTFSLQGIVAQADGSVSLTQNGTGAAYQITFYRNSSGTAVGGVSTTSTTTTYNTSSDQRLKKNVVDAPAASDLIDAIKVRSFDWKSDGSHQRYGMVAQELYAVAPEAVHAPADPDEMMAVDYSKLVPMLIKEIQSLRARVAQLEG